jgi:hypothetical protein
MTVSIRNTVVTLVVSLVLTVMASLAMAQTTTTEEATAEEKPTLTVEKTQIRVQPILVTDVPLNEPVAIDLGQLVVPGVSPTLTNGVTVKAYTRYVEYEGQRIGQLVLTGVEKNGAREPLPANLFNAQFSLDEPRLEPGEDVIVEGDAASLIAALEKLAETEEVAEEDETVEPETVISQDDPRSQGQNSGGSDSNDLAGTYQAPESVSYTSPETVEGINVTTSGCAVRIDIPQMQAYQQSRTETVTDGVVTNQSECSDDLTNTYPLQKSYTVCTDSVDLTAFTATAQYVLYYTDSGGARQEVTECADDAEKMFPIVEKPESCTIYLDYVNYEAVPQSALVYQNDSNVEVQVRGCEASTTATPAAMTQTTDGCTTRHEFTGNISYEQGAYVYELDGIQYQAGGCADTGTTYGHTQVYEDAGGNYVCSPIVDLTGGDVTLQSRVQITMDTGSQYISDCAPDTSSQALVATTDGCDNPFGWEHDLTAGQSYGEERYYFNYSGAPDYVTECIRSSDVYTHQVETTGWQDHDDQLFAYELSTVYIMPPTGRYDAVVSQVLTGATQMPYELAGTEVRENGNISYEGCDKFTETSNMELWARPSGDVYEKPIGPGASLGPLEGCATVLTADWPKTAETHVLQYNSCTYTVTCRSGTCTRTAHRYRRQGTYDGSRVITREDGAVITDEVSKQNISTYSACSGNPGIAPWLPSSAGTTQSNAWMVSLGWK